MIFVVFAVRARELFKFDVCIGRAYTSRLFHGTTVRACVCAHCVCLPCIWKRIWQEKHEFTRMRAVFEFICMRYDM